MPDGRTGLAEALGVAAGAAPHDLLGVAAQEALDVLAVAAGLKPMAIMGCGYEAPTFCNAVAAAAAGAGLAVTAGAPWVVNDESAALPDWYAAAMAREAARPVWFVGRTGDDADVPTAGARLDISEEARHLGYPICCVRSFHRRRRSFHRLMARLIERQAGADSAAMERLARSQMMLAPQSDQDRRRLAWATRLVIAPFTSIALCRRCESDPAAPAKRIGERHRALARTDPVLARLLEGYALPSPADPA